MDVSGVKVPYYIKTDNQTLVLNGAGVRKKFHAELYVLGLYLKTRNSDALKIMNADETMAFKMFIVSHLITAGKMKEATDEGFLRSTEGNIAPIKNEIDQFNTVFKEKIKKGDVFDFIYHTNTGTQIYKNNKLLITIKGYEFKKAMFGLWLYKKLPDTDLRDKLMGN